MTEGGTHTRQSGPNRSSDGGPVIPPRVPPSDSADMGLPPGARRLDVRATRAAFATGTLGTVGDNASSVDEQGRVESGDADGYDPHDVKHDAEMVRQARLRRWQAIR